MTHPRLVLAALATAAVLGACGDEERPPDPQPAPAVPIEDTKSLPIAPPTDGAPEAATTAGAGLDEGDWGEVDEPTGGFEATGGAEATGGEAPEPTAQRYPGPCSVSWSGAARLRFTWNDAGDGGSVRIDGDRDGKSDVCAKFQSKDGRTTEVKVDDGCDKSFEGTITPSYEADSNLATAVYAETKDGIKTKRDITLVALPSFIGVAPGYPLWAAKADVKVKSKKGLVSSASVKEPVEGPPVSVTFTYDKEGRISRVKEDIDADGSIDKQFDYKYDDAGNVTRVTLKMASEGGKLKTKSTASLSYTCWSDAEPVPTPP